MKYNTKTNGFALEIERKEIEEKRKVRRSNTLMRRSLALCVTSEAKKMLLKCVFVEYSGNDRCSKCVLFDIAEDADCAALPCENGYYRYSQDKNGTKVLY